MSEDQRKMVKRGTGADLKKTDAGTKENLPAGYLPERDRKKGGRVSRG